MTIKRRVAGFGLDRGIRQRQQLGQRQRQPSGNEEDDVSIPAPWMDANKAGLVALKNAPIKMADTSYGRFLATQKRDAERAYQHMNAEERVAFLRRLTEINAADAEDRQSPPPSPTPVYLTSNYHYILLLSSITCVLVQLFRCRSRPNAVFKNVTISQS
jgi:hypothetical protein